MFYFFNILFICQSIRDIHSDIHYFSGDILSINFVQYFTYMLKENLVFPFSIYERQGTDNYRTNDEIKIGGKGFSLFQ